MIENVELKATQTRLRVRDVAIERLMQAAAENPVSYSQLATHTYPDEPLDIALGKLCSLMPYIRQELDKTDQSVHLLVSKNLETSRLHFSFYLDGKDCRDNYPEFTLDDVAKKIGGKNDEHGQKALKARLRKALREHPDLVDWPQEALPNKKGGYIIFFTQQQAEKIIAAISPRPIGIALGNRKSPITETSIDQQDAFTHSQLDTLQRKSAAYVLENAPCDIVDWKTLADRLNLSEPALLLLIYLGYCQSKQVMEFRKFCLFQTHKTIKSQELPGLIKTTKSILRRTGTPFKELIIKIHPDNSSLFEGKIYTNPLTLAAEKTWEATGR